MSSPTADSATTGVAPAPGTAGGWAWAALVVAVAGLAGSLYLSLGMGLKACPLCFYQRTFAMSLVAVLAIGLLARAGSPRRLGLLALPLAVAGMGVALFHVSLELRGKLECPQGVLGLGTAPQQSLVVFVVVSVLLTMDVLFGERTGQAAGTGLAGAALGALLAVASCIANPPPPDPPTKAYDKTPEVCRPPFQAP
jgi:disulfide bond formation protein DsbB